MGETKRRGIIKNIIIVFLVIMLVLTLFSNTIMNRTLPEVAVSNSEGGMINSQIKLNGSVSANQTKQITLEKDRVIDTVMVRRGDVIERGALLATLVKGETTDIYDLEIELQRLEIEYKQLLLKEGDSLVSHRRTIEDSEKELLEIAEYMEGYPALEAAVKGYEDMIAVLENDIDSVDEEIEVLEDSKKELQKTQKNYSNGGFSSLKELNAAIDDRKEDIENLEKLTKNAKSERSDALKARATAQEALDAYNDAVKSKTSLEAEIADLEDTIDEKRRELSALEDERDKLENESASTPPAGGGESGGEGEGEGGESGGESGGEGNQPASQSENDNSAELEALRKEIEALEKEIDDLDASLDEKDEKLAEAKTSIAEMKTLSELESDLAQMKAAYNAADSAYDSALDAESDAEDALDELRDGGFEYFLLQDRIDKYDEQIEEKKEAKEDIEEKLAEAKELLEESKEEITKTPDECDKETLALTRAIEDAKAAIALAESNGAIADETAALNLSIKKREIDRKKKQINDLKKETSETEITAPVSGTVSAVGISSGDEAEEGTVAFEITMTDMGYTMECSVTNSQASRLRVGQEAEVQYYYWGDKPSVRISQIKSDPNSGGKNKLVTFTVEGDVSDGTSLSLVVGSQGQSYDTVVPNSAVREDANGKFILKVISKSSPLGNRYYAERVDVEVLASDATKSAINATLSWGDYVITGASVPISEGMQVRMAE